MNNRRNASREYRRNLAKRNHLANEFCAWADNNIADFASCLSFEGRARLYDWRRACDRTAAARARMSEQTEKHEEREEKRHE